LSSVYDGSGKGEGFVSPEGFLCACFVVLCERLIEGLQGTQGVGSHRESCVDEVEFFLTLLCPSLLVRFEGFVFELLFFSQPFFQSQPRFLLSRQPFLLLCDEFLV